MIDRQAEQDDSKEASVFPVVSTRICAVMLVFYALYYARALLVPVATAIVLYLTLRPIVRQGQRWGVPAAVGAAGLMGGLLIVLAFGTYLVFEPAQQTIAEIPQQFAVVKERLTVVTDKLKQVDEATDELAEVSDEPESASEEPVPVEIKQPAWTNNSGYVSGTGNVVTFLTICGALLYFLLASGDRLLRSVMRSLPDFSARRRLVETVENVQEGLGSYLAQVSTINAGLGICVGTAMWLLGMPSPILWGVMAFSFNFIPIVGAIAGAGIIFFAALVSDDSIYYAIATTATFLTLTSLEGQIVTPAILGHSMRMSPVIVFLSIVLWGWMWGMMGVFLSVPILIAVRMTCERYERLLPLALVLGAETNSEKTRERGDTEPPDDVSSERKLAM